MKKKKKSKLQEEKAKRIILCRLVRESTCLVSAALVAGDHVTAVFAAGGLVRARVTETAVVRHRATFARNIKRPRDRRVGGEVRGGFFL